MQDFLNALLTAIVTTAIPFMVGFISISVKKVADRLAERTQSETHRAYIREIAQAVETAVAYTSQTYVDEMKGKDMFNADAQKKALNMCMNTAFDLLSIKAEQYLTNNYCDVDDFLKPLVEAEVKKQKYAC